MTKLRSCRNSKNSSYFTRLPLRKARSRVQSLEAARRYIPCLERVSRSFTHSRAWSSLPSPVGGWTYLPTVPVWPLKVELILSRRGSACSWFRRHAEGTKRCRWNKVCEFGPDPAVNRTGFLDVCKKHIITYIYVLINVICSPVNLKQRTAGDHLAPFFFLVFPLRCFSASGFLLGISLGKVVTLSLNVTYIRSTTPHSSFSFSYGLKPDLNVELGSPRLRFWGQLLLPRDG